MHACHKRTYTCLHTHTHTCLLAHVQTRMLTHGHIHMHKHDIHMHKPGIHIQASREDEEACSKLQADVQAFQEECARDLEAAEPVIAEAEAALNSLDKVRVCLCCSCRWLALQRVCLLHFWFVYMHRHSHMHTHTNTHTCMHTYTHTCSLSGLFGRAHVPFAALLLLRLPHSHTHTQHTCTHIHIYAHTHTHTTHAHTHLTLYPVRPPWVSSHTPTHTPPWVRHTHTHTYTHTHTHSHTHSTAYPVRPPWVSSNLSYTHTQAHTHTCTHTHSTLCPVRPPWVSSSPLAALPLRWSMWCRPAWCSPLLEARCQRTSAGPPARRWVAGIGITRNMRQVWLGLVY